MGRNLIAVRSEPFYVVARVSGEEAWVITKTSIRLEVERASYREDNGIIMFKPSPLHIPTPPSLLVDTPPESNTEKSLIIYDEEPLKMRDKGDIPYVNGVIVNRRGVEYVLDIIGRAEPDRVYVGALRIGNSEALSIVAVKNWDYAALAHIAGPAGIMQQIREQLGRVEVEHPYYIISGPQAYQLRSGLYGYTIIRPYGSRVVGWYVDDKNRLPVVGEVKGREVIVKVVGSQHANPVTLVDPKNPKKAFEAYMEARLNVSAIVAPLITYMHLSYGMTLNPVIEGGTVRYMLRDGAILETNHKPANPPLTATSIRIVEWVSRAQGDAKIKHEV